MDALSQVPITQLEQPWTPSQPCPVYTLIHSLSPVLFWSEFQMTYFFIAVKALSLFSSSFPLFFLNKTAKPTNAFKNTTFKNIIKY